MGEAWRIERGHRTPSISSCHVSIVVDRLIHSFIVFVIEKKKQRYQRLPPDAQPATIESLDLVTSIPTFPFVFVFRLWFHFNRDVRAMRACWQLTCRRMSIFAFCYCAGTLSSFQFSIVFRFSKLNYAAIRWRLLSDWAWKLVRLLHFFIVIVIIVSINSRFDR